MNRRLRDYITNAHICCNLKGNVNPDYRPYSQITHNTFGAPFHVSCANIIELKGLYECISKIYTFTKSEIHGVLLDERIYDDVVPFVIDLDICVQFTSVMTLEKFHFNTICYKIFELVCELVSGRHYTKKCFVLMREVTPVDDTDVKSPYWKCGIHMYFPTLFLSLENRRVLRDQLVSQMSRTFKFGFVSLRTITSDCDDLVEWKIFIKRKDEIRNERNLWSSIIDSLIVDDKELHLRLPYCQKKGSNDNDSIYTLAYILTQTRNLIEFKCAYWMDSGEFEMQEQLSKERKIEGVAEPCHVLIACSLLYKKLQHGYDWIVDHQSGVKMKYTTESVKNWLGNQQSEDDNIGIEASIIQFVEWYCTKSWIDENKLTIVVNVGKDEKKTKVVQYLAHLSSTNPNEGHFCLIIGRHHRNSKGAGFLITKNDITFSCMVKKNSGVFNINCSDRRVSIPYPNVLRQKLFGAVASSNFKQRKSLNLAKQFDAGIYDNLSEDSVCEKIRFGTLTIAQAVSKPDNATTVFNSLYAPSYNF